MPEERVCALHPPSRARSDHTHTCRRSRTLATPSASLARPLRPSLDHDTMPRAAQRTARVARPFIGPPSSLAARPAATSNVAIDGAANELLGPKGRRATAHAHPLPPSAGANAARGHAPPPTPPTARAAGRRQFRRRMLRRHRRCHRHRLVTATAICAAPESASPRRFCRSAAIAEAAVAAVTPPKSSPDAAAAAAIAAPVTEATALAAATVSGSRLPRESGAPRGRGAPDKEKKARNSHSRAHCGLRTPSLVHWSCKSKVTSHSVVVWSRFSKWPHPPF